MKRFANQFLYLKLGVYFGTLVYLLTCLPLLICVAARLDTNVIDIGPPADWVKVNVQKTVSSVFCDQIAYESCM